MQSEPLSRFAWPYHLDVSGNGVGRFRGEESNEVNRLDRCPTEYDRLARLNIRADADEKFGVLLHLVPDSRR